MELIEQVKKVAQLADVAQWGPWYRNAGLEAVDIEDQDGKLISSFALGNESGYQNACFVEAARNLNWPALAAALTTLTPAPVEEAGAEWRRKTYSFPGYMKSDVWKPLNDLHYSEARGVWVLISELRFTGTQRGAHVAAATDEEVKEHGFLFNGFGTHDGKPFMPSDLKEVADWATGLVREMLAAALTTPATPVATDTGEAHLRAKYEVALKVLKGYEKWEADIISSDAAWNTRSGHPWLTDEIYDDMMDLQHDRNAVLRDATTPATPLLTKKGGAQDA